METLSTCKEVCVIVSDESKVEEVDLKWKCGDEELPRVNQATYLCVKVSKDCKWDMYIWK